MTLSEFSVKRRVAITMLTLIIALFGLLAFRDLGVELLPDLEFPYVSVVTTYPGVGSEEIETLITRPVEEFVSSVGGIRKVVSTSSEGLSSISIEFEWGVDLDAAANDIREKLSWVVDYIPRDASNPQVLKFNVSNMPIVQYGVTGLRNTYELREYLDNNVKPLIERQEGVASVYLYGGKQREIQIQIDPNKLRATGVSLDAIKRAVLASNLTLSGGHVENMNKEFLIRTSGYLENLDELRETTVNITKEGIAIRLGEVAQVVDGFVETRGYERTNLAPCVILGVMKQSGYNTVKAVDAVKEQIRLIQQKLPPSVKIVKILDQGTMVSNSISNTGMDGLIGGMIAVFVVWFFLRAFRPTLAIALAIPLSIITTFIGMNLLGYTFNMMTLGGITLAVGLLVDDAVVVIENTFRHLEQGKSRAQAAMDGANEVVLAVTASTFTTMAVFVPLSLAKGVAGKLARPMALVVCLALAASLFVAFTIVPAIAASLFRKEQEAYDSEDGSGWQARLNDHYTRILIWALENKRTVLGGAFALLVASIGITPLLGTEFMPRQDIGLSIMHISLPEGTILSKTNQLTMKLEKMFLDRTDEIEGVVSQVGITGSSKYQGDSGGGVNKAMIYLCFKNKDEREKTVDAVINEVRQDFPRIPGVDYRFEDVAGGFLGGGAAPLLIELYGPDLATLDALSSDMMRRFANIEGLKDLKKSLSRSKPEIHVRVDRDKAARMGLSVYQVADTIQTAMLGNTISYFHEKGKEYPMNLRFMEDYRASLDGLNNVMVSSPLGFTLPVSQITKVEQGYGPIAITRKNQERVVTVGGTNFERDLGSISQDVKAVMDSLPIDQGKGYHYLIGGNYEDMQKSFRELALAFLVAIALIYMIMAAQFESLSQPFVVMFTMPLAYIGVIAGLILTGKDLSVPALMGLVILMGIVVKNGIVMIDYINQLRVRGVDKTMAIIQGATVRLRPILMTSLTAIVGMLPMAFSTKEGSEMSAPMAVAVAFGLTVGMVLTLVVIPVIYAIMEDYTPRIQDWLNRKLFHEQAR